jgi:hypothetical protein
MRPPARRHAADMDCGTQPRGPAVTVYCHVILNPIATPAQLTVLGAALWRWCARAAGSASIYQYFDNQALADLLAGRLPAADRTARPAERWGVRFGVRDGSFPDRRALTDSLWREIPVEGIADVFVDGGSWGRVDSKVPTGLTPKTCAGPQLLDCETTAAT